MCDDNTSRKRKKAEKEEKKAKKDKKDKKEKKEKKEKKAKIAPVASPRRSPRIAALQGTIPVPSADAEAFRAAHSISCRSGGDLPDPIATLNDAGGLGAALVGEMKQKGFTAPTPIQAQVQSLERTASR